MTICIDPPFKTSAFVPYKSKYTMDILRQDFPNETLEQRYDKVSYKMGADFKIDYDLISLNGNSDRGNLYKNNPCLMSLS